MGRNIENAVALALGGFLDMMATDGPVEEDQVIWVESVFQAAYALGRGETRSGRTTDALTAAYRVGARTDWHDLSTTAAAAGLSAGGLDTPDAPVSDSTVAISVAPVSEDRRRVVVENS